MYLYLSEFGVTLIKEAEGNPNTLPHDWASRMEFWRRDILERAHSNTEEYLDGAIHEAGVILSNEQYNEVST